MKLTLDQLKKVGGFSGAPVKKSVTWKKGDEEYTFDVYVRPMSYHTARADVEAVTSDGDLLAHRIAKTICDEDGAPIFTVSDVTGLDENGFPIMVEDEDGNKVERGALDHNLATQLMVLVSEVSGLGKRTVS